MARLRALPWQAGARASLERLLARQVHAVLLHGAAGIGKLDLALDIAEQLLCEQRVDGGPCGRCAGCTLIAAGNHPDLRVVRPEALSEPDARAGLETEASDSRTRPSREIRIEQIRDLIEWVTLSTHRGGPRVIVIEPAESLNTPAANALLKVLEEPPPGTVFLLVSHRVDQTLPTLRSRCVLLRIAPPARAEALGWLRQQGAEPAEGRLTEAGGGPLLALQEDGRGLPGELRDRLLALLRQGPALTAAELVGAVPRDVPVAGSVALFQRWGWDFLAFSLAGVVRYHPQEVAALRMLGAKWRPAEACSWLDELKDAQSLADHPLNAKLAIEGMLLSYIRSINDPAAARGDKLDPRSGS